MTASDQTDQGCSDRDARPVDPNTGGRLMPRAQPGYYPGYDVLSQKSFWDEATRNVVLNRVEKLPPIRFFTRDEEDLLKAVCDRIIPQDDRDDAHRIPVVNFIDERLYQDRLDGYRYADMPPDQEAYRLGLRGISEIAERLYGKRFISLYPIDQEIILKTLHDSKPPADQEIWKRVPVHRFWQLLVQEVVGIYYAHPYAWNEIGFGGPAYPRGYMRLENGDPEPWEVDEHRYAWAPPPGSPSADTSQEESEHGHKPAAGGTH